MPDATDPFVEHRSVLFSIAYRMLGSVTEAEDIVSEAYLRWRTVKADAVADRIQGVHLLVNPEKLAALPSA